MNENSVKVYFGRVLKGLEEELDLGEDTVGQSQRAKGYLRAARRELRAGGKKAWKLDVEALGALVTLALLAEGKMELDRRALAFLFGAASFRWLSLQDLVTGSNAGTELGQVGKVVVTNGCRKKQRVLEVDVQLTKINHSKC